MVVVAAGVAEVVDLVRADGGDKAAMAEVTAVATAKEDTAVATMDMEATEIITVAVGTEVTVATTTVDTVILLTIIRVAIQQILRLCVTVENFFLCFFIYFFFFYFSFEKKNDQ